MSTNENPFEATTGQLERLLSIMIRLRQPDGCPWDRKQDSASLAPYLLEEAHEVLEAIEIDDPEWLCEELGDLLLQIVFHSQIHSEAGNFDMQDVIRGIADKMIRRHPHVFEDLPYQDEQELASNWERIKQEEKQRQGKRRNRSFSPHLPSLAMAQKTHARLQSGKDSSLPDRLELPESLAAAYETLSDMSREELYTTLPRFLYLMTAVAAEKSLNSDQALRSLVHELQSRFSEVDP